MNKYCTTILKSKRLIYSSLDMADLLLSIGESPVPILFKYLLFGRRE